MAPFSYNFFLKFILVFELKYISGTQDNYWNDEFDVSKNCENEGRHQIVLNILIFISVIDVILSSKHAKN